MPPKLSLEEQPFANVERDASIQAWEVSIGMDNSDHDVFQIFFFDDGRTELRRWTAAEMREMLADELYVAIEHGAEKLKESIG